MTQLWTGTAVALVTLFDDDGAVAVEETAEHAARLVSLGVGAVLVNGSTGEAAALDDGERAALVAAARTACPDVPVISGASGSWWRPAVQRVTAAVAAGADAVLVAPPLRSDRSLEDFFTRVADAAGGVPVLAYHWPGVAGGEVPVEALAGLPISGVKDSSGDATRLVRQVAMDWAGSVYTGSPALISYARWLGAAGAIVAAANVAPELCVAAWDGDLQAQRDVVLADHATAGRVPQDLKQAMATRFGTPITCRL